MTAKEPGRIRRMTDEQLDEMAQLREQGGWSFSRLGERFGMSPGGIRWQCLRIGADSPDGHKQKPSKHPKSFQRGGVTVRRFSAKDDAYMLERKAAGDTNVAIAKVLGRRPHAVLCRLMTLGMQADRLERRRGIE